MFMQAPTIEVIFFNLCEIDKMECGKERLIKENHE